MLNALTIDVEDYYHASVFVDVVDQSDWPNYESRVVRNTERILTVLSQHNVKGTFFILGWIAENYPELIKEIDGKGHEIACHSYDHKLIYKHSQRSFREDIRRARKILENITGKKVAGYRAPTFSVINESLWALQILKEEGFEYDSSVFPVVHDNYGIPDAERFPSMFQVNGGEAIREFPMSTLRILGWNIPVSGGGYLRLFPYRFIRWAIKRINVIEKQPAIIYFHPWELDPHQSRIKVGPFSRFRHYVNLDKMEGKLENLLRDFKFGTVRDCLKTAFSSTTTFL
ncbi:MAG: XrtA system polysaccharide deacetylase [Thermodesulfobacteriota bacterium]